MNKYERKLNTLLERKKANKGFTLVELVVVIAIIAVLAGVSVAGYMGYTDNAKKRVAQSEATDIRTAYSIWYNAEHTSQNSVFESIDSFKDFLIENGHISDKANATPSVNYYVEAESLEADYNVSLFYTATNGLVSEFKLGANASDVTGSISLEKYDYRNIDSALSGKKNIESQAELTTNALQYSVDEATYVVNEDQYNIFLNNNNQNPYTESIDGYSVYSNMDEAASFFEYESLEDMKNEESGMGSMAIPLLEMNLLNLISMRKGEKLVSSYSTTDTIVLGAVGYMPSVSYQKAGAAVISNVNKSRCSGVNNYLSFKNKDDTDSVDDRSIYLSFASSSDVPTIDNSLLSALKCQESRTANVVVKPSYVPYPGYSGSTDINESVTISEGNNLTIAQDSIGSDPYSKAISGAKKENPTPIQTITIKNNSTLTVKGELDIGAELGYNQPNTAILQTDKFAELHIEAGSKVVVDGGTLRSYGKITGAGSIEVINGGKIVEPIAITDWRGGQNATATVEKNIFPFLQYDVNNIECPVSIEAGSDYSLETNVYASNIFSFSISVDFIGQNGIFNFTKGKVTKSIDSNKKMVFTASGGTDLVDRPYTLNVSGAAIDLTKIQFPVSNLTLNIESGSSAEINNLKMKVLPTSEINVMGNLTIGENGAVAVYDEMTAYDNAVTSRVNYSYTDKRASGTTGLTLTNGILNVNGTLSGKVGGTGTINVADLATLTTHYAEGYKLGNNEFVDSTTQQAALVAMLNSTAMEVGSTYTSSNGTWAKE